MMVAGGCLCGDVRYEAEVHASDVADYCHCSQCRRAGGAPVIAWVQVSPDRFRVTKGSPLSFASSPGAARWFCGRCGSPLYMTDEGDRSVGITLGTLDHPEAVPPTVHGWHSARIPWFETTDTLKRYPKTPPYDL
ncbi:GFA family protein [Rhodoligotrophos defluvii]|uniref:GFA family protein n=1 Tax=Rhodoligotrophos defluvii TaxID=2561934 RepID=UPI0010C97827|nr:GFA family protein [Rhodoligotrophos defluvii]